MAPNWKWFICRYLFKRHKWSYVEAGGKQNPNCRCGNGVGCGCSMPVYNLTCLRCGITCTLGEDELIDSFAKRIK
jgi:hypothetical protein